MRVTRAGSRPLRPGPGTLRLLAWVARLGVSGIEPAQLVLGLSQAAVYSHIARVIDAGWAWRVVIGDGRGSVVAITRAGARTARAHGTAGAVMARSVAPSTGRHGREVSWVAASLELRGMRWLGPHELRSESGWRSQRDDGTRHTPDLGLVHLDGQRTAIEVELHPKSNERLASILGGYRELIRAGALSDVSYVCDRADVTELVRRRAELALIGAQLHVGELAPIVNTVRERGRQARLERLSG
jgi:hypothetical protein